MKRLWDVRLAVYLPLVMLLLPAPLFAQWEPDVRLTYNDSTSELTRNNAWSVAASGDSVHVVWLDYRDGHAEVYYKRSTDAGLTWGSDARLTYNPSIRTNPGVGASGANVFTVWEDRRDSVTSEIYYKRSTDGGGTWGPDTRLTFDNSWSENSCVVVNGFNVHVAWFDYRVANWEIWYKVSTDAGTTWGPDTRLSHGDHDSFYPCLACNGSNVHVTWEDYRDGNIEVYYAHSTDNGVTWSSDQRLTYDTSESYDPRIGVSDSTVHVVWYDARDSSYRANEIYYKRSTDGGVTWGPDTRLTYDPRNSFFPTLAVSGPNVHVIWEDERSGSDEVYYKRSTDGGATWSSDTALTNARRGSMGQCIAVSGSVVHVVWQDYRDINFEIYYKRNPTGNLGVEEEALSPHPSGLTPYGISPNPFASFAAVPGHEAERFSLYDLTGRMVGTYSGNRIGEGLAAGVYFLRPKEGSTPPVRILKIR